MTERLTLKWGTLKAWKFESDTTRALMQRYIDIGASASAAMQSDTDEQKRIICEIIDALDGEVRNDWTGEVLTKDQAKGYVMTYGCS